MRKGRDGETKKMMELVATIVVASRPPEGRPTGTPTAHAKKCLYEIATWLREKQRGPRETNQAVLSLCFTCKLLNLSF